MRMIREFFRRLWFATALWWQVMRHGTESEVAVNAVKARFRTVARRRDGGLVVLYAGHDGARARRAFEANRDANLFASLRLVAGNDTRGRWDSDGEA